MIKDIIANLSITKNDSVVYAASVAAAFQAHLTGVAFVYDPIVPSLTVATFPPK
jgi:hypothetical protein